MKKTVSSLLADALCAALLSSCAGGQEPSAPASSPQAAYTHFDCKTFEYKKEVRA